MKRNAGIFLVVFALIAFLVACDKDDEKADLKISKQFIKAESFFNNVISEVFHNIFLAYEVLRNESNGDNFFTGPQCATTSIFPFDTLTWPKEMLIDYGDTNCFGTDKRYRRGGVKIEFTHFLPDSLFKAIISFDNFFINDNKVIGTIALERKGNSLEGQPLFDVKFKEMTLIMAEGTLSYKAERLLKWVEGFREDLYEAENFRFEMSADKAVVGQSAKGRPFEAVILVPLQYNNTCAWIKKGVIELQPYEKEMETIDFGSAICNDKVAVTVNAVVYDNLIQP